MNQKLRGEELQEKAFRQIEAASAPAMAELSAALAQLEPHQREAVSNAALGLASAWADAAIVVGYEMARHPEKFLFVEQE